MKVFFQKEKNRAIALMLSVAMVLSLVPSFAFTAFAAGGQTGGTIRTATLNLSNNSYQTGATQNGTVWANDKEGWSFDTSSNTLTLSGVNIQTENSSTADTYGIMLPLEATIVLAEGTTNIVRAGNSVRYSHGISGGTLTIKGTGSLNVSGGEADTATGRSYGIFTNSDGVTIENGTVTISGESGLQSYGYYGIAITVNGGLLIARSGKATTSNASVSAATLGSGMALLTGSNTANFAVYGESGKYYVIDSEDTANRVTSGALAGHTKNSTITGLDLSSNPNDITKGTTNSGYSWVKNTETLTLTNVIINVDNSQSGEPCGIMLPKDKSVTLNLEGMNVVRVGDTNYTYSYGISGGYLTIGGTGALNCFGGKSSVSYGIFVWRAITISDGTVTAIGDTPYSGYGIYNFYSGINISGGTGIAIGGTATDSKAFKSAPAFSKGYGITSGAWNSKTAIWGVKTTIDITKDLFTFTKPSDLTYNAQAKAATVKPNSGITGTGAITVYYSGDNGQSWTKDAPKAVGTYKVKIDVAEGTDYNSATGLEVGSFEISYLETPTSPYSLSGGNNVSDTYWSNNTVPIIPADGYELVNKDGSNYTGAITSDTNANSVKFHLKDTSGHITDEISVAETIKLDKTAPTGSVTIGSNNWSTLLNKITFGLFSKQTQDVTIDGLDTDGSGIAKIEYFIAHEDLVNNENGTADRLEVAVNNKWKSYDNGNKPSLSPAKRYVVYAKITDNCGNVSYINSNGIVLFEDVTATDTDISYTKYSETSDNSVTISLNDNTIKEIKNGTRILGKYTDYTESTSGENTTIAFTTNYLNSLKKGKHTLTISYNPVGIETETATVASTDITINVTLAEQVVTMPSETKTYNGSTQEIKKAIIIGAYGAAAPTENLTYTYYTDDACTTKTTAQNSGAVKDGGAPKNAGVYYVKATNAGDEYYNSATSSAAIFTISPRDITISGITASEKVYNGNTTATLKMPAVTTAMGLVSGDNLTVTANGAFADKNAGKDKTVTITDLTLGGTSAANYKLATSGQQTTATAIITPKALTVNVEVNDKSYDGLNTATIKKSSLNGVIGEDNVILKDGTPTFASVNVANGIAINFTAFSIEGADAGNYTITQPKGSTANIVNGFTPVKDTHYSINSSDWQKDSFVITAASGYKLFLTNAEDGNWSDTLEYSNETAKEGATATFYVKNISTGEISVAATESYKIDKTAPGGDIKFNDSSVKKLLNKISFGKFFKDTVNVKITGTDTLSEVKTVEYYKSETVLKQSELEVLDNWTKDASFKISPIDKAKFIIYVKVTDNAGNIAYFGSDGTTFDTTNPVISGISANETYYTTQKVTVTDDNIGTITVNGAAFTNGGTIAGNVDKTYTIVATDLAGNVTTAEVTMKPISSLSTEIDGITDTYVNADNTEAIKKVKNNVAVVDTANATDGEKSALKAITDKCDSLLKVINDVQTEFDRINSEMDKYTISTVKSSNKAAIESLMQDLGEVPVSNLTNEQRAARESILTSAQKLLERIITVQQDVETIRFAFKKYNTDTVKSTDKGNLEQLIKDIDNLPSDNLTDAEKTEMKAIAENINSLIANIDAVSKEITRIDTEIGKYDVNSVKSSDKAAIEKLIEDIGKLPNGNMTVDEKTALKAKKDAATELIKKIDDVQAEITRITNAVEDYNTDTVKSTDKENLEQLIKDIDSVVATNNITDDEKTALNAKKDAATELIKKIDDVAKEIDRITDAINSYDEQTVELTDKADLEKLIADINKLSGENLTEDEKEQLQDETDACNALLKEIQNAQDVIDLINALPDVKNVQEGDKDAIVAAKGAYDKLTANEKDLVGTDFVEKLAALGTAVANLSLVDEPTGTRVEAIGDTQFNPSTVLVVKPVVPTEENRLSVAGIASGNEIVSLFDISLMLGDKKIQPDGKVKVTLTLTEEQLKEYKDFKVVFIDDNGKSTIVDSVVNGNQITFETDHFSCYGIIGMKIPDEVISSKVNSPRTGETNNMQMWLALLFVSGGALSALEISKKRKKALRSNS